jgi:DNA invertase Pin-like site-specific DNA recombinase
LIEKQVEKKKGLIICCDNENLNDDKASSKMMRQILDATSEYERNIGIERTVAALAAKKRKHERTGNIPYGFKLDTNKKLVPELYEQNIAKKIIKLHETGLSYYKIAKQLNIEEIPRRILKPWCYRNIQLIVQNYPKHNILLQPL